MHVKIREHSDLFRDTTSMAILNKEKGGRNAVLARRQAIIEKNQEIEQLKQKVSQLFEIVATMQEKLK